MALGETARAKKLSLAVGSRSATRRPTSSSRSGSTRARSARPSPANPLLRLRRSSGPTGRTRARWSAASATWVHDKTISGDIIVEQDVHIIDVTNWFLKGHPVKAVGSAGGRAHRQGDAWSHYNLLFTYPGDVHIGFAATQFTNAQWGGVRMQYYGDEGWAEPATTRRSAFSPPRRTGSTRAREASGDRPRGRRHREVPGALDDADPNKQKASSRASPRNLLNEAQQGAESALAGMLGGWRPTRARK